ncbi:MAG TPA: M48 family metallopeptidase [Pyrinomonadaceae bacterium]|nr:M48 family metallopeptidase [Pyrinomonadaceae bacterium]
MRSFRSATKLFAVTITLALAIATMPVASSAQTPIKLHSNKFPPADDIKLGQQAAGEAEKQLQLVRDPELGAYLERVGQRLAAAIPPEFQHPEFQYSFKVVNAKEINAFALPGGPMYVNTGMITAARSEDEMAGVMAHEISHVALRHGTAQITHAQKYQTLAGVMNMGGQIFGGPIGAIAQMGSQGMGVYLLKFSREYETEADLLGARIMANAGYDPVQLANMFKTIESQGGGGTPAFLSDHPSPKDRVAKITAEAQTLQINTAATPDKHDFMVAQQRLTGRGGNQSFTGNQAYSNGNRGYSNQDSQPSNTTNQGYSQPANTATGNQPAANSNLPKPTGRAEPPSATMKPYKEGPFAVGIPDNWQEINDQNGLWFSPNGGFGAVNGQNVFTHGVSFGAIRLEGKNAQQATDEFIKSLTQGSPQMRARGGYQPMNNIAGRNWQLITFDNTNEATGRAELINIATTPLRTGDLLYMIAVCPTDDYPKYQGTFLAILRSIQLTD